MGKFDIGMLVFALVYPFVTIGFFSLFAGPCPQVDLGDDWERPVVSAFVLLQLLFWAFAVAWLTNRIHRWLWESRTGGHRSG
jgi:hypothetical protein